MTPLAFPHRCLYLRLYSVVIVGREVYEWQRGGEATPRASDPRCGRVALQCMRKAVSNPRSNGHGLSLIDTLCAPLALQYLLNDSHSDA